jgi:hypothetical protein
MKHIAQAQVANPMDMFGMFGMQGPPFADAGTACRAWMDGAQSMQAEATEFLNARAGKDIAALTEWTRCTSPTEAFELQARYASEALSDYVAGSQRMMSLLAATGGRSAGAAR